MAGDGGLDKGKAEQFWNTFLNCLLDGKRFEDEQEKEKETIANAIINIQKLL